MEDSVSFTYTWRVENYPCGSLRGRERIRSPRFVARNVSDCEWYLSLDPEGENPENQGFATCYLWSFKNKKPEHINYKLEICDRYENIQFSRKFTHSSDMSSSGTKKSVQLTRFADENYQVTFFIRVQFISNEQKPYSLKECVAKSKFLSNNYTFKWKINCHQSKLDETSFMCDDVVYKAVFDRLKNVFQIKATTGWKKDYSVVCRILLLETDNPLKVKKSVKCVLNSIEDVLQFPIKFNEEVRISKERQNLKNNYVTILVDFFFPTESLLVNLECNENNQSEKIKSYPPALPMDGDLLTRTSKSFCERLQTMYTDKIFSDVEFRVGDEVFSAHRNLLSIQSPVFLAMFSQDMAEKQSGVVEITDVNPKVFDMFLQYFYSQKVFNMDFERASQLLLLSDKYDVHYLMAMCVDFLTSNISTETALDILLTAEAIHQTILKKAAVKYIKSHAPTILKSDQWKQFVASNVGLAAEIVAELTEDLNDIYQK